MIRVAVVDASGFLLKDTPPDELLSAIHVVAGGDALLAPTVTRRLIEEFVRRSPQEPTARASGLDLLIDRELEVLRAVAHGRSNAAESLDAAVTQSHADSMRTADVRSLANSRSRDASQGVGVRKRLTSAIGSNRRPPD